MSSSVSSEAIVANPYLVRTPPAQRDERFGLVYGSKRGVRAELRVSQKCFKVLQTQGRNKCRKAVAECYRLTTVTTAHPKGCVCRCYVAMMLKIGVLRVG